MDGTLDRGLLEESPARSRPQKGCAQVVDIDADTPHSAHVALLRASTPRMSELPVTASGVAAVAASKTIDAVSDGGEDSGGSDTGSPGRLVVELGLAAERADRAAGAAGLCEAQSDGHVGTAAGNMPPRADHAMDTGATAAFDADGEGCDDCAGVAGNGGEGDGHPRELDHALPDASTEASRPKSPQALEVEDMPQAKSVGAAHILPSASPGHEPEIATEYCDLEWMASAAEACRERTSGPPRCKKGHALVPNLQPDHWCDACAVERRRTMGTSWSCAQGCDFDLCMGCARLPRCSSGHVLRADPEPRHWCDACRAHGRRTVGTAYRCSMGCDFDLCRPCFDAAQRCGVELPAVVEEVFSTAGDAGGDADGSGKLDPVAWPKRRGCCRRLMRRFMSRPRRTRLRIGCSLAFTSCLLVVLGVLSYDLYEIVRPNGLGPGAYAKYAMGDKLAEDMEVDHIWIRMPEASETNGNAIFASTQYWFESGVGGYFGTQVWREGTLTSEFAHRGGRREIKRAIFSCWDADDEHQTGWVGENCERFGGEGTGAKCSIPYDFLPGRRYTMRMELEGHRADGDMWTGYITDVASATRTKIGTLLMPSRPPYQGLGKLLTRSAAFLEYFRARGCEDQAFSSVGLIGPYFANRTIQPLQAYAAYAPDCSAADVTACIPEYGCGAPRVLMTAGGATRRTSTPMQQLWASDESRLYV
mmetsp:Transcript_57614/g.166799  ORF Transcript_57614/g.166799 Transcript_57614/m.166799 type:complete len:703 (+) Transcript_57614:102-2210(+)